MCWTSRTNRLRCIPALVLAGLSLTACAPSTDFDPSQQEAGAMVRRDAFGAASLNNELIQSGQKDFAINLGTRFAAEVPTTITFAFNSAVLDEAARRTLRQQAHWIRQFPEVRFTVFGHTDAVGSAAYNKRLGLRRAQAVVRFLSSQGISRNRLDAVVSFGETQPLIVSEGRQRQNRRTVTDVTGFVKNNPLVLDGKYAQIVYRDYVASAEPQSGLSTLQSSQLELVPE